MLSEMLGPRGMAFDNDDALEDNDDEDLKNDPVSTMDMRVCLFFVVSTMCIRRLTWAVIDTLDNLLQGVRGAEYGQLLCSRPAALPGRD